MNVLSAGEHLWGLFPVCKYSVCLKKESPKKGWFIQSGLCDLATVKGLFKSSALILYTNI